MRQHAIPQNILDIEFKLFSKFTIREFIYIAIGVGFGSIFLFLFSGGRMPGIIAIPIFVLSTGLGLFFGLAKINEQKADVYVKNFFVAITSPTQRVWRNKKFDAKFEEIKPELNLDVTQGTLERGNGLPSNDNAIVQINPVKEISAEFEDSLENEEEKRLNEISSQIGQIEVIPNENLLTSQISQTEQYQTNISPVSTPIASTIPTVPQLSTLNSQLPTTDPSVPASPISPVVPTAIPALPTTPTTPTTPTVPIEQINPPIPMPNKPIKLTIGSHNFAPIKETIPGLELVANSMNLVIRDKFQQPLTKCLVFIKDNNGKLNQAIMSDSNGYAITGKNYPNGNYFVTIQKDNFIFPEFEFILDGTIIEPIKIIPIK